MRTESQSLPIVMNLCAAALGALGQLFYKWGAQRLGHVSLLRNWPLWAGMLLFCGVMLLFVGSFKMGGKLSVVYPVYATTFVWGALLAAMVEGERLQTLQWVGLATLIAGVTFIALGRTA